jgi:hypothetical protein
MLVHPDWLSTLAQALGAHEGVLGIDAFLFDEIAGGIPHQGECELTRYGLYLRPPPLLRLMRGVVSRTSFTSARARCTGFALSSALSRAGRIAAVAGHGGGRMAGRRPWSRPARAARASR